jgi:pimeloyl-ACP methyl ester carboxylesterase
VIGVTWPSLWALSDWSVVPTALVRLLSFENKADDAEEVGATWLRDVISYAALPARKAARAVMQERAEAKAARVVLVGHSFGARALVAALTQRPQLQPPAGLEAPLLERGDPVLLLEGAFEFERLFDRDPSVSPTPTTSATAPPARLQRPFSAGDPMLTLTASDYDTAVRAAVWGWYAGDARTYDQVCMSARDHQPWRGLDLSEFGCGVAQSLEVKAPYGLDLCQQSLRQGTPVDLTGKRVAYFDASHMINCNAPFTGGGAHSDIYRRETARFLLDRIVASP